jgi:hypothetical protein
MIPFLLSLVGALQVPSPELLDAPERMRWRAVGTELAKTGERELVERMREFLAAMGEEPRELERLMRNWERTLDAAKPGRSTRASAARRLERELPTLAATLANVDDARRAELAGWILRLDQDQPEVNAALGRERGEDGTWRDAEERQWHAGQSRISALEREARALEFSLESEVSKNPALLAAGGGHVVRAERIEVHGNLPLPALERILLQALRAAAFSNGLIHGSVGLPKLAPQSFVLLASDADFPACHAEALAQRGLTADEAEELARLKLRSYLDTRGWRLSRWRTEADFEALLLWSLVDQWLPSDPQPCLRVGHVNSVCLRFLGTSAPTTTWLDKVATDPDQRTSSSREDARSREARWRAARATFHGCRSWLVRAEREGRAPAWARTMLDQDGKIVDELLVKATLVCEFHHATGEIARLLEATHGQELALPAFEKALGQPLPEFEQRFRRWLDPRSEWSIRARLRTEPATGESGSKEVDGLLALNQARANALKGQTLEFPLVALDEELARNAALHAHYLTLNPEQQTRWPGAHEEYPDRPGFSPEGSLSGLGSVIAFEATPAAAVQKWLGTFYHRLPLLNPGLFGVGFGADSGVIVLDVRSLVLAPWQDHVALWPMEDALDVPRACVPEIPSPVPGEDLASLGYPITIQLFFRDEHARVTLALELFRGAAEPENLVPCHVITPDAPLFVDLAPENVWGLVPRAHLAAKTSYTARANWLGQTRTWSFTTGK